MIPTLAQLNPIVVTALVVVFLLVCIAMILLILIQRPQGGGLSGAFGAGGGAGQTAFGTKTGDVLTIVTIGIFILFLVTAIILNFAARPASSAPSGPAVAPIGEPAPAESQDSGDTGAADEDVATDLPTEADAEEAPVSDEPAEQDPPSDDPQPDDGAP